MGYAAARVFGLLMLVGLLAACAGSTGAYRRVGADGAKLAALRAERMAVEVDAARGVPVTEAERQRIAVLVARYLPEDCPAAPPVAADGPADVIARILITRYDKGNAFARAMLIGLGQIHIEGRLTLEEARSGRALARYDLSKTFAWGGFYGGFTRMEDVEHGFARAAVAAICEIL